MHFQNNWKKGANMVSSFQSSSSSSSLNRSHIDPPTLLQLSQEFDEKLVTSMDEKKRSVEERLKTNGKIKVTWKYKDATLKDLILNQVSMLTTICWNSKPKSEKSISKFMSIAPDVFNYIFRTYLDLNTVLITSRVCSKWNKKTIELFGTDIHLKCAILISKHMKNLNILNQINLVTYLKIPLNRVNQLPLKVCDLFSDLYFSVEILNKGKSSESIKISGDLIGKIAQKIQKDGANSCKFEAEFSFNECNYKLIKGVSQFIKKTYSLGFISFTNIHYNFGAVRTGIFPFKIGQDPRQLESECYIEQYLKQILIEFKNNNFYHKSTELDNGVLSLVVGQNSNFLENVI